MSRFYAEINSNSHKSSSTKCGGPNSKLNTHIRGWDVGIYVECEAVGDKDVIHVYRTGGSNDSSKKERIISITNI